VKIFFWIMIIFIARFLENYLVRMGTLTTLSKKENWATILDLLDESLGLLVYALIIIDLFYLPYCFSSIIGSAVATRCVACRWPKFIWEMTKTKKKIYKKKFPFSTA
jgi:Na+/proline symporter